MKYVTDLPVRFGEIDHAGVVYYPRFFHYFHQAFENWFGEALGVPYSEVVTTHNIGFPCVRVETDFRKFLSYGDIARVEIEIDSVGEKSLAIQYTLTRMPAGECAAVARIVTVAIDNDTMDSIAIPEEFRRRFLTFKES